MIIQIPDVWHTTFLHTGRLVYRCFACRHSNYWKPAFGIPYFFKQNFWTSGHMAVGKAPVYKLTGDHMVVDQNDAYQLDTTYGYARSNNSRTFLMCVYKLPEALLA